MLGKWNKNFYKLILVVLVLFVFLFPDFVSADETGVDVGLEYGEQIGLKSGDPRVVLARIVQVALGFLGLVAVSYFLYGGWLYMTSEGNSERIDKAISTLKNATIGIIIILASFAIVTFIINQMMGILGEGSPGGGSPSTNRSGGLGALGSCSIKSVYPEAYQEEVPRNTSIIVSFRDEVDPETMCNDNSDDGVYCNCSESICDEIIPENVRIFKTEQGDSCELNGADIINCDNSNEVDVYALSNDYKTFVFVPDVYLGSPTEYIWHSVYLSADIQKAEEDESIFDDCQSDSFEWSFEVSNKIDLTPPQVKEGDVFPIPDDEQDEIDTSQAAVKASGVITVGSNPQVYEDAYVDNIKKENGSINITTEGEYYSCSDDGSIRVSVTDSKTVNVSGVSKTISGMVSGDDISDGEALIGCGLALKFSDTSFNGGESWTMDVHSEKDADTLTVGRDIYIFGEDITVDSNSTTASNIATKLNERTDISATATGNQVNIEAIIAGSDGNNIALLASSESLTVDVMSGGGDAESTTIVNDKEDKPRNAVIQINFNEAINPLTVSGEAGEVSEYIAVKNNSSFVGADGACQSDADCISFNCGESSTCVGDYLDGRFLVSNQYRTVEFVSNNKCGVNGCGEDIYCLPENSNIVVELVAAKLASCTNNSDCADKSPYNTCNNNCQDSSGINYPTAELTLLNGIMDVALNSLDGNRNENAEGPVPFYNENDENTSNGDSYKWSFFINDQIDLEPPVIKAVNPSHELLGVDLSDPVEIKFNKLMMSSSLSTGSTEIYNGQKYIEHKLINIWNFTGNALGYWVTKENSDSDLNGEVDETEIDLKHSIFDDMTSYRSQVGSGVKDIYQNCFKPSQGPACSGIDDEHPSCCSGTLSSESECP